MVKFYLYHQSIINHHHQGLRSETMRRLLIGSGFVKIADLLGSVVTVFDKELVRLLILKDCRFFFKLSRWTGLDVMELGPDGLLGLYNHR